MPLNKVSKLTITNVNQADSGYYECRVRVEGQRENIRFELQPEQATGGGKLNNIILLLIYYLKRKNEMHRLIVYLSLLK